MAVSEGSPGAARRGRPPTTDRARRERRLHISRQAVRLFREQGVTATSGRQIAHAAEVSERTLWRLFRTKESCVEPLLSQGVEVFQSVVRTCPPDRALGDHLRAHYDVLPPDAAEDHDAVLAIIRMTRDDPALRAVWLLLQERAEPALAELLERQTGRPADSTEIRVRAAGLNAALRVVSEDLAWSESGGPGGVEDRRRRVAAAFEAAETIQSGAGTRPR